eukprot:COSAG02_NODE_1370_length_13018_cov_50.973218_4_plen_58_part_00
MTGTHLEGAVSAPLRDELHPFLVATKERLDPFLKNLFLEHCTTIEQQLESAHGRAPQ